MKINNYEEKEMIPLTKKENQLYREQEKCHICEEKICIDKDDENYTDRKKVKDHCPYTGKFRGAAHSKCNLNYKVLKETSIIIHNASYDTHFLLNQLAKTFKGELNCIGDNMEKYITFSVPIKKEVNDGKKRKQLHTILNLLTVLDLCQLNYQNLLITDLEFLII